MSAWLEAGERFVAAASPKFAKFEHDRDRIGTAVVKAMEAGELDREAAAIAWVDKDDCLSLPLQRRYVEAAAWDALVAFHLRRLKEHGRSLPWPDPLAGEALTAMVAHGRAAQAIGIARAYGEMQIKRIRHDISTRNRRGPRRELDELPKAALEGSSQAIANAIPDRKRDLLRDLEAIEPIIRQHGCEADCDWLDSIRREIWMERRA